MEFVHDERIHRNVTRNHPAWCTLIVKVFEPCLLLPGAPNLLNGDMKENYILKTIFL